MRPDKRAALTTRWPLIPGHAIVVRPLLPDDADLLITLGQSLSAESLYQRFLNGGIKQNPKLLNQLVNVDFARDLALIATITFADDEIPIGVARFARTAADPRTAEFAVTVADAWQGRGIGKRLLRTLVDHADAAGIDRLTGDVLATNLPMLALARSAGFRVLVHPDENRLRLVSLDLKERRPAPADLHEENEL